MVIAASLQACGVVFPFAMLTSICRSIVTICSGLYLWMGMTVFPPSGFSLIPPGTNLAGHVRITNASAPASPTPDNLPQPLPHETTEERRAHCEKMAEEHKKIHTR